MSDLMCKICGANIQSLDSVCQFCGATIEGNVIEISNPKTIEELQKWCISNNISTGHASQFQIGNNCYIPGCFGIYKSGNDYVVYKVFFDGEKMVRYQGTDESFAVTELLKKIKEEICKKDRKMKKQQCVSYKRPHYKSSSRKEKDFMVPIAKKIYLDSR